MISKYEKLLKTLIDINNIRYNIKNNNLIKILKFIYRKMIIKKKLISLIKKNQIKNNLQTCILYNNIKKYLLLNYFQRIIIIKIFYHAIIVKRN